MKYNFFNRNSFLGNPLEHLLEQFKSLLIHDPLQVTPQLLVLGHGTGNFEVREVPVELDVFLRNALCFNYSLNLLRHVFRWKEGLEGDQLREQTPQAPYVYFLIVLRRAEQDFRRPVPKSDHLISVLLCWKSVVARQPEVSYFDEQSFLLGKENDILRLQVSMQNGVLLEVK